MLALKIEWNLQNKELIFNEYSNSRNCAQWTYCDASKILACDNWFLYPIELIDKGLLFFGE